MSERILRNLVPAFVFADRIEIGSPLLARALLLRGGADGPPRGAGTTENKLNTIPAND